MLAETLADDRTAVVLLDVVIGYGAHADPASELVSALPDARARQAVVITSVCGTEDDPQSYSRQARVLEDAGVDVAPSNAHAAEIALDVLRALA
jgi:FdrA protein